MTLWPIWPLIDLASLRYGPEAQRPHTLRLVLVTAVKVTIIALTARRVAPCVDGPCYHRFRLPS
jgi:hypothetical protein